MNSKVRFTVRKRPDVRRKPFVRNGSILVRREEWVGVECNLRLAASPSPSRHPLVTTVASWLPPPQASFTPGDISGVPKTQGPNQLPSNRGVWRRRDNQSYCFRDVTVYIPVGVQRLLRGKLWPKKIQPAPSPKSYRICTILYGVTPKITVVVLVTSVRSSTLIFCDFSYW
jgi:hypothetical protein